MRLRIRSLKSLGSIICEDFNFFSFINLETLFFFEIKKRLFFLSNNKWQFGIGLLGLSQPLIFNNQATFSGAVINK